jgi:hypothetical protein
VWNRKRDGGPLPIMVPRTGVQERRASEAVRRETANNSEAPRDVSGGGRRGSEVGDPFRTPNTVHPS